MVDTEVADGEIGFVHQNIFYAAKEKENGLC